MIIFKDTRDLSIPSFFSVIEVFSIFLKEQIFQYQLTSNDSKEIIEVDIFNIFFDNYKLSTIKFKYLKFIKVFIQQRQLTIRKSIVFFNPKSFVYVKSKLGTYCHETFNYGNKVE